MKNKTKLVLGLSALLAVTAGAATTSTLAWFTTSRNTTVNFSNAGIYTNNGNLQVSYTRSDVSSASGAIEVGSSTDFAVTDLSITGITKGATDVSLDTNAPWTAAVADPAASEFYNMYQPVWKPNQIETEADATKQYGDGFVANSFDVKKNALEGTESNYVHFQIRLKNTGTSALEIYLSDKTTLTATPKTAGDGTDVKALQAARVAIYKFNNSTTQPTLLSYFANSYTTTDGDPDTYAIDTLNYVKKATSDDKLYGCAGYTLGSNAVWTSGAHTHYWNKTHLGTDETLFPAITAKLDTDIADYNTITTSLAGNSFITLDVLCWLEGTSAGAVEGIQGAKVNFALDFVAL